MVTKFRINFAISESLKSFIESHPKHISIEQSSTDAVITMQDMSQGEKKEFKREVNDKLIEVVSRVFTIYQLAYLITHDLPKIIEQFSIDNKVIVIVVYGLLHLFSSDPHIDRTDAKNLIKEISSSLRKLSKEWFVIVSFTHSNRQYTKPLITVFDKCIEITNDIDDNKVMRIDIKIRNRVIKRKCFHYSMSTRLSERELLLVPSR
jgi:hypothetical protein